MLFQRWRCLLGVDFKLRLFVEAELLQRRAFTAKKDLLELIHRGAFKSHAFERRFLSIFSVMG